MAPGSARRELFGLGVLYVVSVAYRFVLLENDAQIGYVWLPGYIDVFTLGMLLAVMSVRPTVAAGLRRTFAGAPALVLAAAGVLYLTLCSIGLPAGFDPITTSQYQIHQALNGAIAFLLVGVAAFGGAARSVRWLGSPPMRALGLISYGIFLWHLPLLHKLHDPDGWGPFSPFVTDLGLTFAGSVVFAALSYRLFERPLLDRVSRSQTGSVREGERL